MAISRIVTYTSNTVIDARLHNMEHDMFTEFSNSLEVRIAALEGGDITQPGVVSFSNEVKLDLINEYTLNNGVVIDSVHCKDGMITVSGTPTVNGQIGYSSNQFLLRQNGTNVTVPTTTDNLPEGSTNKYFSGKTTTNLPEGTNLYYTTTRFDSAFAGKSTTNLTEGTNLYYTAARFNTAFAGKTTTDLAEGVNLYYTDGRFDTRLATKSTDDLVEGATNKYFSGKTTTDLTEGSNLYYTNTRFDTRFASKSTTDLTEGVNLYYTQTRFDSAFGAKTTTDLIEGANLYYTAARFNSAFAAKTTDDLSEGIVNKYFNGKTTTNLPEGTNLYYTDGRFDTRFATKTTTDLAEGTNLYFTNTRADARIAAASVNDLTDVSTAGATNGQALIYQSGTWQPGSVGSPTSGLFNYRAPAYLNTTSITAFPISATINGVIVETTVNTTVNVATTGLNGLDTGAPGTDDIFYLYLVAQASGSGAGFLLSTVDESTAGSITLPGGYTLKKQLPFAVIRQASTFIPFVAIGNYVRLRVSTFAAAVTPPRTQVLAAGAATVYTAVNCSAFVPSISNYVNVSVFGDTGTTSAQVITRAAGIGFDGTEISLDLGGGDYITGDFLLPTNTSQVLEYKWAAASSGRTLDMYITGFYVDKVAS